MVFEDLQPERVLKLRSQAEAVVGLTAMSDFPTADFDKIEAALDDLVDRRPFDPAIRLAEANAAFNAITQYGTVGDWLALERWGDRLQALARTEPFDRDPAIRLEEAKAAYNAVTDYGRNSGRFGEQRRQWFVRLARCARWFPTNGPIQAIARDAGVSIVEQEAHGWPYGRDQGTARTGPSPAPVPAA
jgi:hypothetical protein